METKKLFSLLLLFSAFIFAACNNSSTITSPDPSSEDNQIVQTDLNSDDESADLSSQEAEENHHEGMRAVYVLSNLPSGNMLLVYNRNSEGMLTQSASVSTGGTGTGGSLGSQGSICFNRNKKLLLAVNPGSNSISIFLVKRHNAPRLIRTVSSNGVMPVSITAHKNIVYVLNSGGTGNITGFRILGGNNGILTPIENSTRSLSSSASAPAQISFARNGSVLIVTEKSTNKLLTYTVGDNGVASGPMVINSAGQTPFGFALTKDNRIIVSEAFNALMNASTVSSYTVGSGGSLSLIQGPVATNQTAACWVVVTRNGKYAYTTNTESGTITGLRVNDNGTMTLLNPDGITANNGAGSMPIDAAMSNNSKILYVLNSGAHSITAYRVNDDGSLTLITTAGGLPAGAAGLAAR
jgi:6-phosphogluconolactonase (cycloisomerase 2 family)